ncbi:hypothetical protein D9613_007453 [Agrocybe pediades]|uniref:Ankyrin n=1 Tax=Agrocybe pediades TaxID=84607 RepID=A0A8H4QML0_9AGAR|nr:hypothetical protein D9613_007453 [Agrocybe pediades]
MSLAVPLPVYVEGQIPQSPFDAVLTRICAATEKVYRDSYKITNYASIRRVLDNFVESQKAPTYTEAQKDASASEKDGIQEAQSAQAAQPSTSSNYTPVVPNILDNHIGPRPVSDERILETLKQRIVVELFNSIGREDIESITLLIQNNLVTANTCNTLNCTPLLAAIGSQNGGNLALVITLLDLGADPNQFGSPPFRPTPHPVTRNSVPYELRLRTPLMFSAHIGSLPIVKVLFEPPYNADDALVAPDGQIALRLAVDAGHRHIVEYLPSRRAGGWRRFKVHHALAIKRIKNAAKGIYYFSRFFLWEIPRFFLWSVPKHVVVLPIVKGAKWCWKNRGKFGRWCKEKIRAIPEKVKRGLKNAWVFGTKTMPKAVWKFGTKTLPQAVVNAAKWTWELLTKRIPEAIVDTSKWTWELLTKRIPKAIVDTSKWVWELLTKRIPRAMIIFFKWIWRGVTALGEAVWSVVLKFLSLLHTTFAAIISFLRSVTLKDVLAAFTTLLRSIFIDFPSMVWGWIQQFGEASYRMLKALFGSLGELVWFLGDGIVWTVTYLPKKVWVILKSLFGSLVKGLHEVWVWISPKA